MKTYPGTKYNLDNRRSEEINIRREELLSNYEKLVTHLKGATGWDKVDIEEAMLAISEELEELNEEFETLNYVVLH